MKSSEVNYAIVISSATLLLLTYVSLLLACIDSCCTFVLLVLIYVSHDKQSVNYQTSLRIIFEKASSRLFPTYFTIIHSFIDFLLLLSIFHWVCFPFCSSGGIRDGVEFLILLRLWRITRIINGKQYSIAQQPYHSR